MFDIFLLTGWSSTLFILLVNIFDHTFNVFINNIVRKPIYIYIYIYVCVCVCVCVYLSIEYEYLAQSYEVECIAIYYTYFAK